MINGVFLMNTFGDVLVQKVFTSSKQRWSPGIFHKRAVKNKDVNILSPCVEIDGVYYVHVKQSDVYVVVTLETADISSFIMMNCLNEFVKGCCDLIGELTSEKILDHIAIVYELVIKTFGLCNPDQVSTHVINECKQLGEKVSTEERIFPLIPNNLFGISPSREDRYKKAGSASRAPLAPQQQQKSNEIFLDIKEFLTVAIDWDGQIISTDLKGVISSKSYLTVPVNLHITLTDKISSNESSPRGAEGKITVTNKRFHAILKSEEHEKRNDDFPVIKHLSNPGYSDILDYHVDTSELPLPFTMYHNFTKVPKGSMTELTLTCKLFCALPAGISPINWSAKMPLPSKLHAVKAISTLQSMTFSEDDNHRILSMQAPIFPSRSHHSITVTLLLTKLLPFMVHEISFFNVHFEVPDLCISNMNIQGLKVQNVTTNTTQIISKWIRRSTHSKDYQFILKSDWMD